MESTTRKQLVPFHRPLIEEDEVAAVAEVVRSGWLTMGPRTMEFEKAFAKYIGAEYAVAVSSCTAALHLALEAIGLKAGDEVLLPTTTFTATAEVVVYFGARPVLVDIDPETMNMDPEDARGRVTSRTRVIIPVHFAGQPCEMSEIFELAAAHDIKVIEDAAHAFPASYQSQLIGTLGEITAFSFYVTKPLCTGEGGMITTDVGGLAERMRLMRLHGTSSDAWKRYTAEGNWYYQVLEAGFKYNMTDVQAALGLVQLGKANRCLAARRRIAEQYSEAFQGLENLEIPLVRPHRESAWHLYVLRIRPNLLLINRDTFIREMAERGIGTSVHFIPLHMHPYYQKAFGYKIGDFPKAEYEYQRCISLPIYPGMSQHDVEQVISSVVKTARKHARC